MVTINKADESTSPCSCFCVHADISIQGRDYHPLQLWRLPFELFSCCVARVVHREPLTGREGSFASFVGAELRAVLNVGVPPFPPPVFFLS